MMRRLVPGLKWFIPLLTLLFNGCGGFQPPQQHDFAKERIYNKTFDKVWQNAIEWFAQNGTPIKNLDKSSGFIATDFNLSTDQEKTCMDCGDSNNGFGTANVITSPTGNFNIVIKRITDDTTKVAINVFFKAQRSTTHADLTLSAQPPPPTITNFDCTSRGLLEKQILDYLGK